MKRRSANERRWTRWRNWAFWVSVGLVVCLAVIQWIDCFVSERRTLVLGIACCIVGSLFAITVGIDYLRAIALDKEELDVARRMQPLCHRASELLTRASSVEARVKIIRALGKEGLDENAEWTSLHTGQLKMTDAG